MERQQGWILSCRKGRRLGVRDVSGFKGTGEELEQRREKWSWTERTWVSVWRSMGLISAQPEQFFYQNKLRIQFLVQWEVAFHYPIPPYGLSREGTILIQFTRTVANEKLGIYAQNLIELSWGVREFNYIWQGMVFVVKYFERGSHPLDQFLFSRKFCLIWSVSHSFWKQQSAVKILYYYR